MNIKGFSKHPALWVSIFLVVLTLTVYWQVFYSDFIDFDDDLYVTGREGPYLHGLVIQVIDVQRHRDTERPCLATVGDRDVQGHGPSHPQLGRGIVGIDYLQVREIDGDQQALPLGRSARRIAV